jgi:hypothetical protein
MFLLLGGSQPLQQLQRCFDLPVLLGSLLPERRKLFDLSVQLRGLLLVGQLLKLRPGILPGCGQLSRLPGWLFRLPVHKQLFPLRPWFLPFWGKLPALFGAVLRVHFLRLLRVLRL